MERICVINEQLKEKFVNAITNKKPEDGKIKMRFEVSDYLEDKNNIELSTKFLIYNMQDAVKDVNSAYSVGPTGYGNSKDIKEVTFEVTIICGGK